MPLESSSIAHLLGRASPAKKAKTQRLRMETPAASSSRKVVAKATPAPTKRKGAALRFDHLVPAPSPIEEASAAEQILAAGAKARAPSGTGAQKPKGLAADILAAGKKRRGEV